MDAHTQKYRHFNPIIYINPNRINPNGVFHANQ